MRILKKKKKRNKSETPRRFLEKNRETVTYESYVVFGGFQIEKSWNPDELWLSQNLQGSISNRHN